MQERRGLAAQDYQVGPLHRKDTIVKMCLAYRTHKNTHGVTKEFGRTQKPCPDQHLEREDPEMGNYHQIVFSSQGQAQEHSPPCRVPVGLHPACGIHFIPLRASIPPPTRRGSDYWPVSGDRGAWPSRCRHCVLPELSPNGTSLSLCAGIKGYHVLSPHPTWHAY